VILLTWCAKPACFTPLGVHELECSENPSLPALPGEESTASKHCISPDALNGPRCKEKNRSQHRHSACPNKSRFVAE
jgi:hypothetical protein